MHQTDPPTPPPPQPVLRRALDVAALFLRMGFVAFGGPAAHVAMMREEVVDRRRWIDEQHFLDMLGATNLIPGPNSSEMAIHIGYVHAGLPGMILAGIAWMLPAFFMVLALSWAYIRFGATPTADAILYGIKPVIIPIIISALIRLGKKAVKGWVTAVIGLLAVIGYLLGGNVLLLLFGGGLAAMLIANLRRLGRRDRAALILPALPTAKNLVPTLKALVPAAAGSAAVFSLGLMFLTFFKVGLVMYGSGYTLFAFLQADFVTRLGWLTEQQLIDAIAVGQMTPGPLFTTTTFIGYLLGTQFGMAPVPTAILATVGFYIPSFGFVALSNPIIPRVRHSSWASSFLDGVNVAALGAMAGVTWFLGRAAYIDLIALVIGAAAALALFRFKVSSAWIVIGGALTGLALSLAGF